MFQNIIDHQSEGVGVAVQSTSLIAESVSLSLSVLVVNLIKIKGTLA